jgi:signal transduction histidine kinase
VVCDGELIQRVLVNLLGNATKFMSAGGEIRISIAPKEGDWMISVTDTGPGIPPQYHEKIFDKFGQVDTESGRKKYSTGLGLTFCKLAVEAHGGRIGVESCVGKGSTFWFILPVRKDGTTEKEQGETILVKPVASIIKPAKCVEERRWTK